MNKHKYTVNRLVSAKYKTTTIILVIVFLLSSCEKVLETYIGLPLQPTNINSEYKPGLNIFGMLKAGNTMDTINHFFEVHFIPYVFDTITDINIYDANIALNHNNDTLLLTDRGDGHYYNYSITPTPGDKWNYSCVYDTFNVTSSTIIPNMPTVDKNTISIGENNLSFKIKHDTSAYMYDIYYIDEYSHAFKRIVPDNTNIEINLNIDYHESSSINRLYVIAYDKNYEKYVSTSNTFFKPNAFRPRFTTVNGGYGCFGSLTSLSIDLKDI